MADVKQTLNGFIDYANPKLCTVLSRTWKNQQQAITYKEIREAIFAGQLDPGYLAQWQQDYSKFIINGYAPLAQQAIDNSAHELQALFGLGAKSLNYPYMDSFIASQGGKLIREVTEEQYKAINILVRQASFSETMDVQQLAKAIRPTIGLTARQSQAAFNRYQEAIANGATKEQAQLIQAKYAERLHRTRAETIAITEMAYAYNYGQQAYMEQCIKDGLIGSAQKKWMTALDERVCDICGKLDGEITEIDAPFSTGVLVPPGHPRCRCVVNYINVTQPADWVDTTTAQQAPTQTPDNVDIPDDIDISGLQYQGKANLGGTGEMHLMTDGNGDEWIFKPAQTKSGTAEPFRAYVQEAGYKVQGIIDPDSAVQVGVGEVDIPGKGKVIGAAQRKIGNLDKTFDLEAWQKNGGTLDPNIVSQLQRENVTDWLLGNYDCHGRNFVLTQDGKLIGVDKEQAFRYLSQSGAQSMSLNFHPNSIYHETEPVYNTLYRRFANNQIDIRLNDTLAYIKRIEAVPDAEYREIFRGYAEALYGKGQKAEQFLDKIVFRKQNVRATFETFYSELLTQRKGVKTVFTFIDTQGATMVAAASPVTNTFTPAVLKGMKLADLQAIAKAKGIKSFGIMHKDELIDAISDPSKVQAAIDSANKRYQQLLAGRKAKKAAQAATGNSQFGGVTQLSDALKDIDGTLQGSTPRGVALISDDRALEGLETNLRKITIDGKDYYELSGKLTQTRWEQTLQNMSGQSSGSYWRWNEASGGIDYTQPILNLTSATEKYGVGTKYIRNGDDIIIVAGNDATANGRALMGQFNIRVQASSGAEAARKIQSLMSQAGISDIADDVTKAALDRYKKMRVIWQTAPSEAQKLNAATVTDGQIDNVLKKLGITQKRLDAIQVRKVADGYWTLYDPENVALANKYGAAYLYHEANSIHAAANVLTSGELLSTTNRFGRGITAHGASSFADIRSGGADSVFTRLVFKNQIGKEQRYGSFGDYVFVFDTKALERTDWYAYTGDKFGKTDPGIFYGRYGTKEHFEWSKKYYRDSNELLFRRTLPMDTLKEVRVPASDRQALIDMLHSVGIDRINGIRLEDLIKVGGRLV